MTGNKDKVAIVTGAAKNIGRATCDSLSKLGFNILVHANSDKAPRRVARWIRVCLVLEIKQRKREYLILIC